MFWGLIEGIDKRDGDGVDTMYVCLHALIGGTDGRTERGDRVG